MGAGERTSSRKNAGKASNTNSKVVQGGDVHDTSSEDEQLEGNEEGSSDLEWARSSEEEVQPVVLEAEDEEDDGDEDDDEQNASPSPTPEDLADGSTPESALDAAWGEITDVLDGTEYDLEANTNQGGASKKSNLRSTKSLGKMKALDAERLTAALKNLKKATYGTVNDIDAEKHRKLDKNKARNQAVVSVAAEYITDEMDYDKKVEKTAQDLKNHSTFFFDWPVKAKARAEILESRKIIKYNLEPLSVKKEAEAKIVAETDRIARQLELTYLDRTMLAQVTAHTTKAAGNLAKEKGFAGKLKRARETARVKVAVRFVEDMDEYKQLIEDDCRPASEESDEILPAERKRVEIKHAAEIIKNLEGDEKLAALEEIDELALATLKERAAKKKPAPSYLIDKYTAGTAGAADEESRDAASSGIEAGENDRQSDEESATDENPKAIAPETSNRLATLRPRVRIQHQAGQKRKRNQKVPKSGTNLHRRNASVAGDD